MIIWVVGQFGNRTIWHRTIRHQDSKTDNLAARRQKGHFGTKIMKRTIWHQHSENGQFGTNIIKQAIWHRNFIGINFIEIVTKNVRVVLFVKNFQKV